jgi:hypothetical protein
MSDDRMIEQITEQLDAGVERLDGATRSRLTQARHRALAARHRPRWILPAAGGAVLASIVAVMVWMGRTPDVTPGYSVSDFEMLTSSDSIELYRDVEFLQWLDEKEGTSVI